MRHPAFLVFASFSVALVTIGCGGDGPPGGTGGSGGSGATGGSGVALMLQVPTVPEVQEDCAGAFDTSAPPVGEPATFTIDGDRAIVRGTLGPTTPERLQAVLDDNPGLRTLVLANVPGTVDAVQSDEAARMGRRATLATCVPSDGYIASGAVDLFLAGAIRQVNPSYGGIGVHGWITEQCLPTGMCPLAAGEEGCVVGSTLAMDDPQHDPFLDYYEDIAIDESLYWWIFDRGPNFCDPHFMTPGDVEAQKFETTNACTDAATGSICNIPPGAFTGSCRGCFLDEPTLSCDCQGPSGSLQATSIDVTTCAGGTIDNCGGVLMCGECEGGGPSLFNIEWDADVDLTLLVTDPENRTIQPGGSNQTPNCTASEDMTGGAGSVESVDCESPIEGVYQVQVQQNPAADSQDFTFVSPRPAAGPVSAPYAVAGTEDIYALVSDTLELELSWTLHHNLELILVDPDGMRAVTPHGTGFDPLPGCTTSADNTGSDVFESVHVETISCTGLAPGNYQVEVENPGGGSVLNVSYTVAIGDGNGSEVEISTTVRANTRREHELVVLGLAGVVDDVECTMDAQCQQPADPCREAVCDGSNTCVQQDAGPGTFCSLDGGGTGACQAGRCLPL
jgi:hypothetical protein